MASTALRDKKRAVGLVLVMLLLFYVGSIGIEYLQAARHGYGTGFTNQYHVAPSVVRQVQAEDPHLKIPPHVTARELSKLTLGNHGHGLWHDLWRWLATITALVFLLAFWYFVISRLGTI
jgi:hypothetical protein